MLSSFYMNDYLNPNDPSDMDDDREDDAEETEIEFKQWTMTDLTELTSVILPENEWINLLVKKLDNITTLFYCQIPSKLCKTTQKYDRCRWSDYPGRF